MNKKTTTKAKLVKEGNTVNIHYVGTFNDGKQFDSSHARNETLSVTVGQGNLIKGFDNALVGMKVGETKKVHIKPAEGYGEYNPKAKAELPKDMFPDEVQNNLKVGMVLPLVLKQDPSQPFPATTESIKEETYVFDLNHPLAGKDLNFEIELISIESTKASKTKKGAK